MQTPVEARGRDRAREVGAAGELADRPRVMIAIAVILRGEHRDGEHLRVAQAGQTVAPLPQRFHRVINHDVNRYNQSVVHGSSVGYSCR